MTSLIKDVLFPPHCAICDRVISPSSEQICKDCRKRISYVAQPACMKCGKRIESEEAEYCLDCTTKERSFEKGFPLFDYKPPVSDSIVRYKYGNRQEYALFYADEIIKRFGNDFRRLKIEALVPVPIHKKKLMKRGYNQAGLIASEIGKRMGIQVIPDLILRSVDTKPQKELNDLQREKNLRSAFVINPSMKDKVPGVILLVDDIYTTGSTIESCTRICLEFGALKVYYTSVAIGAMLI